jgi:ATP-binding cassette, subfamily B, bacterial PglK
MSDIKQLWSYILPKRRVQFCLVLMMMILSSVVDVISLGAVIPFLGVLSSPEKVFQYEFIQPFLIMFEIGSPSELILPFTVLFIFASIMSALLRIVLLYSVTRLSYATGLDISVSIFERTIYQDYKVHLARNSSEIINSIIIKTETVIGGILLPILMTISSFLLLVGIVATLVTVNPLITFVSFLVIASMYLFVTLFTRKKLSKIGKVVASESTLKIKSLQEGLGGIRDVLVNRSQQYFVNLYKKSDVLLRRSSGTGIFIGSSPRFFMEAGVITLIAIIAYIMSQKNGGIMQIIPILGLFALGAQRLVPALQNIFSSYAKITSASESLKDVLNLLNQQLPNSYSSDVVPLSFNNQIELNNAGFSYSSELPWVFRNIDIKIKKGSKIGFIGETGCGKSTLVDTIMGLLYLNEGEILVDGEIVDQNNIDSWRACISHVPQSIYLSDSSVEENIAFGIPIEKIDHNRVQEAAKKAQIESFINQLLDGYKTVIGERGVRFSGGQLQRLGIARALYKKADVLVFDEATSALDNATENDVIQSINMLDSQITILIIAHRISTLKGCDQIIKIQNDGQYIVSNYENALIEDSKNLA